MNTYEILFLFDPTVGASWETVEGEINRLMSRAKAEVLLTKRLEERRLAFEVKGRKRGLYALTYFKAEPDKIAGLERDIRISESILRALILRADQVTEEQMRNVTLGSGVQESRWGRDETAPRDESGPPAGPDEGRPSGARRGSDADRELIATGMVEGKEGGV